MPENKSSESYSLGWVSVCRWPWLGAWVSSQLLGRPTADTLEGGQRLGEKCDGHGPRSICPSVPDFSVCVHLRFSHLTRGASLMGLQTAVGPAFCPVPTLGPAKQRRHMGWGVIYCSRSQSIQSPPAGEADTMGGGRGGRGAGRGRAAVSHQAMAWGGCTPLVHFGGPLRPGKCSAQPDPPRAGRGGGALTVPACGRARRLRGAGLRPDGRVGGTTEACSTP